MNPSAQQMAKSLIFFPSVLPRPLLPPSAPPPPSIREQPQLYSLLLLLLCYFHAVYISVSQYKFCPACKRDQNINFKSRVLFQAEAFPCCFCFLVLFVCFCFSVLLVPCGKFGSLYLGKAQQPKKHRYPFLSVCVVFSRVRTMPMLQKLPLWITRKQSQGGREKLSSVISPAVTLYDVFYIKSP